MIVDINEIKSLYDSGVRIGCIGENINDQFLAIAKYMVSKKIQRPTSEMIAIYDPRGKNNILVRAKPK